VELLESISRFDLLDHVPVGICVIDKNYKILFWNISLENWTEISSEEANDKNLLELFPHLKSFKYRSRIESLFSGGPPTVFSSQLHKNIFKTVSSDENKIFHTTITAVPAAEPGEYYAMFSVEDVTALTKRINDYRHMRDQALDEIEQRKKTEAELHEKQEELQELNATKDKFFSIISHDLKNPIAVFLSISEMLSKMFEDFSPEELKDFLDEMNKSAKKLNSLLENLLQWSRAQTGRLQYNPDTFDLRDVVQNSIMLLKMNADKKNIGLISDVQEQSYVYADINMVDTVLRNLISNAIKFTPEKGKITISDEVKGEFREVSVTDTGLGISEEDINKLFRIDVHHTTIGTSKEKGTGLGLILCKEFIEKNGGEIWVESRLGEGTTFYFTLPTEAK
jgi:PAS domain S-box-containing protein